MENGELEAEGEIYHQLLPIRRYLPEKGIRPKRETHIPIKALAT